MRVSYRHLLFAALALSACRERDARPAKQAVAEAKGAAAEAADTAKTAANDAKAVARETAASVETAVHDAKAGAESAADQARVKTDQAAQAVQGAAASAARGVREFGEGGVVTGRVSTFSPERLRLHPEKSGPHELRLDTHTRYLLPSGALATGGLTAGTRVRATYVVEAHVPVATEVEVLPE